MGEQQEVRIESGVKGVRQDHLNIYEGTWSEELAWISDLSARGLSAAEMADVWMSRCAKYSGFIPNWLAQQVKIELAMSVDRTPPNRLIVRSGTYQAGDNVGLTITHAFKEFIKHVDPEVDCIVEFGSGLGFNLAILNHCFQNPSITYVACEPSASGRRGSSLIFANEPGVKTEIREFDYCQPDLGFLDRFKKVVAFTNHSIEQVMIIAPFYDALLKANIQACIHMEPIGWQRSAELRETVSSLHADTEARHAYLKEFVFQVAPHLVTSNAAHWSLSGYYNLDLLQRVGDAVQRGMIALNALDYDVIGANPFNPSTLLSWTRTA